MTSSTRRFLTLALGLLGHLNIVSAQASSTEGDQAVVGIDSGWKYEDSLSIVPLHPKARTGLIDRVTEEGLISVAGPRFANEFYDESDNPGGLETRSFKCIVKCAAQVIELAPCIPVALATENPAALLKCLSLSQLCNCAECLPDAIENLIKSTICSSSSKLKSREEIDSNTTTAAPTALPPYAEYMAVTEDSVHHQAIRGELTHHRVAQIKTLNRFFAQPEGACVDAKAGCFIGSVCGSCGCCVGGCLNGTCIGACA